MKCGIWMCNTKWVATRGKEEEGEMGADCPRVLTPSDPLQEINWEGMVSRCQS